MNDPTYLLDIVLFAAVTVFLIFRLKNVLGKKHGEERKRPNIYDESFKKDKKAEKRSPLKVVESEVTEQNQFIRGGKIDHDVPLTLAQGLEKIQTIDPYFTEHKFLKGAQYAFEMIIGSFAEGDLKKLKSLCSPEIYKDFEKLIKERQKLKQKLEVEIIRIDDLDILKADLKDDLACITLTITSHQKINLFDAKGKLIEGDQKKAEEIVDRWIFERDVKNKNPNWTLVEMTSAG